MKKILAVFILKLLPLLCMVCGYSGCVSSRHYYDFGIGEAIDGAIYDAKKKNEFTAWRSANPLDSPPESRLSRRTSTLAEGTPVDVSPYLLHNYSFIVTEKGIQRGGQIIKISGVEGWYLGEYDAAVTFTVDKQSYQMNLTAAACEEEDKEDYISNRIKQNMKEFAAGQLGIKPAKIQDFQVEILNKRLRRTDRRFDFENVFIQKSETCYFLFDVEVEYQKRQVKKGKNSPENFAVFNKEYHSDLMTAAGAAIELQTMIWNDACKAGYDGTPLPVINVVKAVKVTETEIAKAKRITDAFSERWDSPFTGPSESRLSRRTSKLSGGSPVDISPWLLHKDSFVVTEQGIQHYNSTLKSVIPGNSVLFEFDTAITFQADNQNRQMNATVALSAKSKSNAQDYIKKYMLQYAAKRMGLDPKTIKNFNVKFLKIRKGQSYLNFRFDDVFIHDIEPGYFLFDADVEYQKWENAFTGSDKKVTTDLFAVFNGVYQSDFTIPQAAALDVQTVIWNAARMKGFLGIPLPVINVVKAVKVKP